MQSTPRERLLQFSHVLQRVLFERLEQEMGPLNEKVQMLVAIMSVIQLSRHVETGKDWVGRPSKDR